MSKPIKVDLNKATIADFLGLISGDTKHFLNFCDKVVDGGVMELSLDELPAISSAVTKALHENSELISMAIASMLNYFKEE